MHLLALRTSDYLNLKPDPVLKHWACAETDEAELNGDDEICRVTVEKFEGLGGVDVSYAEIAKKAWEAGRTGLATKVFLHLVFDCQLLIPILIAFRPQVKSFRSSSLCFIPMKEDKLTLVKAVESGDTDLGWLSHFRADSVTEIEFSSLPGSPPSTQAHAIGFFRLLEEGGKNLVPAGNYSKYMQESRTETCCVIFITSMTGGWKVRCCL
jgi:vacuolar protein sorting-associated protein 16